MVDYPSIKKAALDNPLMQLKVPLSNVQIDNNNNLIVENQPVYASQAAVRDFYKLIGVPSNFAERFGILTGDTNAKADLVKIVKDALAVSKRKKVIAGINLIANPETNEITGIMPGNKDLIPNEIAFQIFEKIMNEQNLEIRSGGYDMHSGLHLNVTSKMIVEKYKNEGYHPGFTFKNSLSGGVSLKNFVLRLICMNGMTEFNGKTGENLTSSVRQLTPKKLEQFFTDFKNMAQKDFIVDHFDESLKRAMEVNCSFAELLDMKNVIVNNSAAKDSDLHKYLPEWGSEVQRLVKANIDYLKCTDMQLKNHATHYKVWDIINRVTDFGSHNYGLAAREADIQAGAGRLFVKKEYDASNLLVLN